MGVLILCEPRRVLLCWGCPQPVPLFFTSQSGVFHLILSACYLWALLEPALIRVIILSQAAGVAFRLVYSVFFLASPAIQAAGLGDAVMLIALYASLAHSRR